MAKAAIIIPRLASIGLREDNIAMGIKGFLTRFSHIIRKMNDMAAIINNTRVCSFFHPMLGALVTATNEGTIKSASRATPTKSNLLGVIYLLSFRMAHEAMSMRITKGVTLR